jgi:hypothetical protein
VKQGRITNLKHFNTMTSTSALQSPESRIHFDPLDQLHFSHSEPCPCDSSSSRSENPHILTTLISSPFHSLFRYLGAEHTPPTPPNMAFSTSNMFLLCAIGIILLARPAHAFGAGNIGSTSKIEGQNWRHGDLEDTLLTLVAARAMGGKKFSKLDVKRVSSLIFVSKYLS